MQNFNNQTFEDLIRNAQPLQIAMFDKEDNFKGYRNAPASTLTIDLNSPFANQAEMATMSDSARSMMTRAHTAANTQALMGSKPNQTTWKHMILSAGTLARAGMSVDTSGNFEGFPFFQGFDDAIGTTWLGEGATIPENSAPTTKFPYEIHSLGAFTMVSRRFQKMVPSFFPQLKIAQANAIKDAVEKAFIQGNSTTNPAQPDGLVRQVTKHALAGASKSGLILLGESLEILEGNGLSREEVSIILSPDVAKKFRLETGAPAHQALSIKEDRILVSRFMPAGTMVSGRYSDFQAVTNPSIEFLAHTYTPAGQPETGATRVRSVFEVDAVVLNQDSFVKTTGIA